MRWFAPVHGTHNSNTVLCAHVTSVQATVWGALMMVMGCLMSHETLAAPVRYNTEERVMGGFTPHHGTRTEDMLDNESPFERTRRAQPTNDYQPTTNNRGDVWAIHSSTPTTPAWFHVMAIVFIAIAVTPMLIYTISGATEGITYGSDLVWTTDAGVSPGRYDTWFDGVTSELLKASTNTTNNVHQLTVKTLGDEATEQEKALASRLYVFLTNYCRGGMMKMIMTNHSLTRRGDLVWRDIHAHYTAKTKMAREEHARTFWDKPDGSGDELQTFWNRCVAVQRTLEHAGVVNPTFAFEIMFKVFCEAREVSFTPPEISELCRHSVQEKLFNIQDKCDSADEAVRAQGNQERAALTLFEVAEWVATYMRRHPLAATTHVKQVHREADLGPDRLDERPRACAVLGGRRVRTWTTCRGRPVCQRTERGVSRSDAPRMLVLLRTSSDVAARQDDHHLCRGVHRRNV